MKVRAFGDLNGVGSTFEAGNTIAFNDGAGIEVTDQPSSTGNRLLINSIHDNGTLGIDLGGDGVTGNDPGDGDSGPNNLQNFPVLTAASTTAIAGTLDSAAGSTYTIGFYASPSCDTSGNGEGATFLGAVDGRVPGAFSFNPAGAVSVDDVITATAMNENTGDTSEFSACRTAESPPDPFDCPNPLTPSFRPNRRRTCA